MSELGLAGADSSWDEVSQCLQRSNVLANSVNVTMDQYCDLVPVHILGSA